MQQFKSVQDSVGQEVAQVVETKKVLSRHHQRVLSTNTNKMRDDSLHGTSTEYRPISRTSKMQVAIKSKNPEETLAESLMPVPTIEFTPKQPLASLLQSGANPVDINASFDPPRASNEFQILQVKDPLIFERQNAKLVPK